MSKTTPTRPALWTLAGTIVLFAVWETFVRAFDVRPFALLAPSRMVAAFYDTPSFYLEQLGVTARHMLFGLAISLVISISFGALLASSRAIEFASQPLLVLILVTPWVAYITSVVLWVGRSTPAIIFLVAFVTIPAFVFATVSGMRGADPAARELFASIDATRFEVLWHLRLPSALPALFTAARFNVGLGLAAAYYAEGSTFSTSSVGGLGHFGRTAANNNEGEILWTLILSAALLGVIGQIVVVALERWLLRWHSSQRNSPI